MKCLLAAAIAVSAMAMGNALAVWDQQVDTRYVIYSNRYDAAAGQWGAAAQPLEAVPGSSQYSFCQIAIDAAGNALVVWAHYDVGDKNQAIYARRFDAGTGTWGEDAQLIDSGTGFASAPQVVITDASGNALAVWDQQENLEPDSHIYSNRYDAATGRWGDEARPIEIGAASAYQPQLAVDSGGDVIAVWEFFGEPTTSIRAARFE